MGSQKVAVFLGLLSCLAAPLEVMATPASPREPIRAALDAAGISREALVYLPVAGSETPAPVLFAFHGHGGTPDQAARSFRFHELWPEAIVMYPKGLPTPGSLTDSGGMRPGWQSVAGGQGDRDLAFFDALLEKAIRAYGADPRRVFAAGHSNGGSFVYLLWAYRGGALAAVAPSGSILADRSAALTPKPAFHIAGRSDPLVKFAWQERMIGIVKKVNHCMEGEPWGPDCAYFPSATGTPFVAYVHQGGHEYPSEASDFVVRFFRQVSGQASIKH